MTIQHPERGPADSYEITLSVGRVKEEHIAYSVAVMNVVSRLFGLDGTDVNIDISVERNRDGIERFHEYVRED